MGPIISQIGNFAIQSLTQLAKSAGGKYMMAKGITKATGKIKRWWESS